MPPKPTLTHFLCLPLVTETSRPQLQESLLRFSSEDFQDNEGGFITSNRVVRPLGTLHLTLGVMSLLGPERLEAAANFLRDLDLRQMLLEAGGKSAQGPSEKKAAQGRETGRAAAGDGEDRVGVSDSLDEHAATDAADRTASQITSEVQPLIISLSSLVSMHPKAKTSILYAHPSDPTNRILPFCQTLQEKFREAELLLPDDRPLKLHATILNTIYAVGRKPRGDSARRGHGKYRSKLTIDAGEIVDKYQGFEWAKDITLGKLAICKMGARKITDTEGNVIGEEYEELASKAIC
ncbi:MAG: hypothetical protein M1819_002211 [Sarea resinae]|nr:MAG: hypothetical protein M1819_002211 [Sarea resinae]